MPKRIKTFVNKPLKALREIGRSKIDTRFHSRILRRLDVLDASTSADDMNLSGFDFHALKYISTRYAVHVNGPWCITFEFRDDDAYVLDFEQYY
ncbi:type II toxin-antitoxin system RelE/ParE family toxin [Acetobacter lovaniensis]|nr:plasmid maintenance system killer [Acetobacter lovaniensis]